jgi:BirA family transcriptional regulator, biotin operon repressor / biotin---[acetyl-CoA-carboxylase] ligase
VGVADHRHRELFESPESWSSLPVGGSWSAWYVEETGSTNADLIASAAPDLTVLIAGHQTAGRGRLDRRWDAPPGTNLLMSILFRQVPDEPSELTRRVAVAVVDGVASVAGLVARLKWPNDVLLDGRKLAGILAQRRADGAVVVGVGLNVGWAPDGAASLGESVDVHELAVAILHALAEPPIDLFDTYRSLLDTIGRTVKVELPDGHLVGRAIGLDEMGRLLVLDGCAITHHVDVGDVVHLRPAD